MIGGILLLLGAILLVDKVLLTHSNVFVLDKNIHLLILGDSHTKYGLNDKILDNACNLSNDADSYFYSYLKFKAITKNNNHLDALLLSFSQHNVEKNIEERWLWDYTHLEERLKIYYVLLDIKDFVFLLKQKPIELFTNLFPQILYPLKLSKGRNIYGGFSNMDHNNLKEEISKYMKGTEGHEEKFIVSSNETAYLEKIKDLCKAKKIELIFINTPLHKTISGNQENLYIYYKKYFSDVPFLDFSKLELPDSCFDDMVHLSPEGSSYFSKLLHVRGIINLANESMHNSANK